MFVTYFYGCWWLPSALSAINLDTVRLGKDETVPRKDDNLIKTIPKSNKGDERAVPLPDHDDMSCRTHPYEQAEV